jgi:hypothetical protein
LSQDTSLPDLRRRRIPLPQAKLAVCFLPVWHNAKEKWPTDSLVLQIDRAVRNLQPILWIREDFTIQVNLWIIKCNLGQQGSVGRIVRGLSAVSYQRSAFSYQLLEAHFLQSIILQ